MFGRLLTNIYQKLPTIGVLSQGYINPMINQTRSVSGALKGIRWDPMPIHKVLRCRFPRPKETKRVKQGFKARMSTLHGRKIIMRRILNGKSILTH
ncbi:hypothetical protein HCN44_008550 [Aphidius gifuensis]|uniref:39S ribosomal protein L34, mitochondrial n=1 Tax=Aphidius gifuensis TaxID=684658 RepID=A0A834XND3_APHGI|nr:uncharacterized protein LOC122858290 [Aphidius gifuensis]KAF7989876.1 hypothetical protein HCN44_008550 [Aphidius gifuensis]